MPRPDSFEPSRETHFWILVRQLDNLLFDECLIAGQQPGLRCIRLLSDEPSNHLAQLIKRLEEVGRIIAIDGFPMTVDVAPHSKWMIGVMKHSPVPHGEDAVGEEKHALSEEEGEGGPPAFVCHNLPEVSAILVFRINDRDVRREIDLVPHARESLMGPGIDEDVRSDPKPMESVRCTSLENTLAGHLLRNITVRSADDSVEELVTVVTRRVVPRLRALHGGAARASGRLCHVDCLCLGAGPDLDATRSRRTLNTDVEVLGESWLHRAVDVADLREQGRILPGAPTFRAVGDVPRRLTCGTSRAERERLHLARLIACVRRAWRTLAAGQRAVGVTAKRESIVRSGLRVGGSAEVSVVVEPSACAGGAELEMAVVAVESIVAVARQRRRRRGGLDLDAHVVHRRAPEHVEAEDLELDLRADRRIRWNHEGVVVDPAVDVGIFEHAGRLTFDQEADRLAVTRGNLEEHLHAWRSAESAVRAGERVGALEIEGASTHAAGADGADLAAVQHHLPGSFLVGVGSPVVGGVDARLG